MSEAMRTAFPGPHGSAGQTLMEKRSDATVVVIDDDDAFRHSLTMVLSAFGFEVRSFASAEEFIAVCDSQTRGQTQGCLLIDVHLPGLDGFDAIEELRRRGLSMPALLMTGRPDAAMRERAAAASLPPVMEKPTPAAVLIEAIRRALGPA